MLPKKNRANTKDVDKIFKVNPATGLRNKFLVSSSLTLEYFEDHSNKESKISFIAPKSIAKLAVKRNLLRRRGYSALERHIKLFPAKVTGVFIFKKYQDDVFTLANEIKSILNKIN